MTRRILVPLDGSELAEMALPHAIAMAHANLYGLTLLRVFPPPVVVSQLAWAVPPSSKAWESSEEEADSEAGYLKKVAAEIVTRGVDTTTQLIEGIPLSAITDYVEEHPEVVMIVMSTHGRSGIGRWVLGSVAEHVLHSAAVPVLLIRPSEEERLGLAQDFTLPLYKSLVVPLDQSPFGAQALGAAQNLAKRLQARMTLVSALPSEGVHPDALYPPVSVAIPEDDPRHTIEYLDKVAEGLRCEGIAVERRVEYGEPAEVIVQVAEKVRGDLIVMSTHGRTGLPRLLLGSVAMQVVHAAHLPVLLIRPHEIVAEEAAGKREQEPAEV